MADPNTGVNNPAAGGQNGGQTVPLTVVEELKTEIKDLKNTVELQSDQLRLYQANQPRTNQPNTGGETVQHGGSSFEGLDDESVITVGDLKRVMAGQDTKIEKIMGVFEVRSDHPDFTSIINKYVPILTKTRPDLANAIQKSGNPALLAYEVCKSLPEYKKDLAEGKLKGEDKENDELSEDAQKLLANQGKPGSPSGAGGGGKGQESVDYYVNLSEDDLEKKIEETKRKG